MRFLTVVAIWLAFSLSLFVGCAGEKSAKEGDTVKIKYTGKLEDGTIFDSSEGRDPIQFKIGDGNVIPGFEKGVIGMKVGDKRAGLAIHGLVVKTLKPVRGLYSAHLLVKLLPLRRPDHGHHLLILVAEKVIQADTINEGDPQEGLYGWDHVSILQFGQHGGG